MSKHTDGPWTASGTEVFDEKHRDPVACCLYRDFDISVANAHLIAAAPDLLEALEWAMKSGRLEYSKRTQTNSAYCDGVDRANAIISKAKGL